MKIAHIETLISEGAFPMSSEWETVRNQVHTAVASMEWPVGSGSFTIYPQSGKKSGEGNGVVPIKLGLMNRLVAYGWQREVPVDIATRRMPGDVDAAIMTTQGLVCLEYETGNISSSHRSLNKLTLGLMNGAIIGGFLVIPSRKLYKFLTDRIGNFDELQPYLDLWRKAQVANGFLEVVVVEQDAESMDVPRIPKGTDGRAGI